MIASRFFDLSGDEGMHTFDGWQCLNCGEVADPVILNNRSHRPDPVVSRARVG